MKLTISACAREHAAIRAGSVSDGEEIPSLTLQARICAVGVLSLYFLFFHRLDARDLWSSHEARAGMDAQTILDDGVWGMPRLYDGRWELQKPPLYYWLVASIGWLRGGTVDAWAVRLPAAWAALLCVLAVAVGLRQRSTAAFLAAAILATAVHFTWLARIGRIDMPLTLCVTVAVGSLYLARGRQREVQLALLASAYIVIAAGVMLKGPIGFVLPAAVTSAHLLVEHGLPTPRRWRNWRLVLGNMGILWGMPLVAALTLPWFCWVDAHTHGEFFRVFIRHHNLERGWGGSNLRSNPWWFYFAQFFGDFLPWSPLLPLAIWWTHRRGWWRCDAEARFGLTWFVSVLLVLSCARFKRADYLLPAYPGAAVFLGCIGERWLSSLTERIKRIAFIGFIALAGVMAALWFVRVEWQLPANEPYRDYRALADCVRRLAPRPREIVFFRTEAHPLAFHLGRPVAVVVQWGELQARLRQPGSHYIVTPPDCAAECRRYLPDVCLQMVMVNTDLSGGAHERPLVLLRAEP